MAKKLLTNYTFDPSANTITVQGIYARERFLIITNTTANQTIFLFNDPIKGISSYSITPSPETTIIVLDYDCSLMSSSDTLQVFVEVDYTFIEPSETFVDPVNKLRVTNPQNLIDTDFEYGLQSTKWETLELVNNIPSFYSNQSDYIIPDVISVQTTAGSENIVVTTGSPHGISIGAPIDIQGLGVRTAEGKFLVSNVIGARQFVYKSKGVQLESRNLAGIYTTITPGQFYSGSNIKYTNEEGIYSDLQSPSTLTFETDYVHGFENKSSLYITNTVGRQIYNITDSTTSTANDGSPVIDFRDTVSSSFSLNSSLTETKQMTGTYARKFTSNDVNVTNNTFSWPSHGLRPGDALLYVPSAGDQQVGGLQRFQIYYVKSAPTADTITLCETTNGNFTNNATIDITSAGTSNFGRHEFILCYEIAYMDKPSSNYVTRLWTRSQWSGVGSGWDLRAYGISVSSGRSGYYGLGKQYPSRHQILVKNGVTFSNILLNISYFPYYSTSVDSNFTVNKAGVNPDGYDFIEDFNRFDNYYSLGRNSHHYFQFSYIELYYANGFNYGQSASYFPSAGTTFYVPLMFDAEADTFYKENHGLQNGSNITITTTSGSNIVSRTDTSTSFNATPTFTDLGSPLTLPITVVSNDRFTLGRRISRAPGTYSAVADVANPLKDTVYIQSYNLVSNEEVVIKPGPGGVLPTTLSGPVIPSQTNTLQSVYNTVTQYLDGIKSGMGGDSGLFYLEGSAYQPFTGGFRNFDGGTQYMYAYGDTTFYSPVYGSYSSQWYLNNNWANGLENEIFPGTILSGKGYRVVNTPFVQNTTIPYWLTIWQTPYDQTVVGANSYTRMSLNGYSYNYGRTVAQQDNNNFYTSWISLSNGWRYTFDTMYAAPGSGYHGYMTVLITIDNSAWPGYYQTYNGTANNLGGFGRSVFMSEYSSTAGQRYTIHALIPIKATASSSNYGTTIGNVYSAQTIAQQIAQTVVNSLTRPSLTAGTANNVYVNTVNGDRISFKNATGQEYNFADSGTAPIVIETLEKIGGVDGYYDVINTTDYSVTLDTASQIPQREILFTSGDLVDIDGVTYVNLNSHRFKSGQSVIYTASSGEITGLTSGNTYFVVLDGPDHIRLADSYLNAVSNQAIAISSTSGNFSFTSPTISAISPGDGTVETDSDSPKISGTNTSFRRYFKSGDTIRLKDSSVNPPAYRNFEVVSVIDDTECTVDRNVGFTDSSTNYYVETQINVRPDGSSLHRPFDGGVEINAGTSPNSSIVRQTRKYFRYQSGKGIQVSLAINFNPSRLATSVQSTGSLATIETTYPHGIVAGNRVMLKGASDDTFNGTFDVTAATDFTFTVQLNNTPNISIPDGIISYNIDSWANSSVRAGLFDYQNGMFFEFDGSTLYTVRRSSVQQIPGSVNATYNSNKIFGNQTSFVGQVSLGDFIVIRGMSYKVTAVISDTELHIQPSYRGISAANIVMTKTIDTKIPQDQWNVDKCDGTGRSGFLLDLTKIQMAYIDYSWYGAGKIRFGFKDTYGKVVYVHEFIHNNRLEEAYMRSGNIPARYEIYNDGLPTYVPGLFHWGTSVIMDGRFDDDKAYLFTAPSRSLTFTNGDASTATTNSNSVLEQRYNSGQRSFDWYVRLSFPSTEGSKFTTGTPLYAGSNNSILNGEQVSFTAYSGSIVYVYIYITTSRNAPAIYPVVNSSTIVSIGAPSSGGASVDLSQLIPLISIRLAPSVDNNLSGPLGQREIVNRMQLQLKSTGITLSHDCDVYLVLNGSIDNKDYEIVGSPSLSQLIKHSAGDKLVGGSEIFSFRASGGSADSTGKRLNVTTSFDLSEITDLGNSILGGDSVFPNGPDLLTIAIVPVNTSDINSKSPLNAYARITWTESQA